MISSVGGWWNALRSWVSSGKKLRTLLDKAGTQLRIGLATCLEEVTRARKWKWPEAGNVVAVNGWDSDAAER